jgi:hypothetical protein
MELRAEVSIMLSRTVFAFIALWMTCPLWGTTGAGSSDPARNSESETPPPTGPFSVGKVTVHWTDESRIEPLSTNNDSRELMVDIWYPAEASSATHVEYLDVAAYYKALGAKGFKDYFGAASETVRQGVKTHAVSGAPYARSAKRSPALIFSPGGGMIPEVYTSQFEDLASHGYVVAAISHPYDAAVTIFPDGRQTANSDKRWPAIPSLEGDANLNQLEWHANDIRFVLDQLSRANVSGEAALPFAGYLDLSHVGAFGHSIGGIAAAHACQLDRRIKACINQDGMVGKKPLYLDVRGWAMDQEFMLILHDAPTRRLSDEEVAEMKMSRERLEQLIRRLDQYQETVLRNTGKGSYRVRLQSKIATHMDFSDLPWLAARDHADAEKRLGVLATVRSYTLAFFDKYLRGMKPALLDQAPTNEFVEEVQRFEPARAPCQSP